MTVLPINSLRTPRFCGVPTFMRLPIATSLAGLDAAIIGLPSDSGGPYRTGARFAPNAIRGISTMLRPINPYRGNINIFERLAIADVGDAAVVPGYEEESLEALEESLRALIDANVTPFAIGGDHSVTLAELRALAPRFGPVALVQFDSHTDTWDSYFAGKRYSAGTPFRRAVEEDLVAPDHSIQIGMRGSLFQVTDITQSLALGYDVLTCDAVFEMGIQAVADRIADAHRRAAVLHYLRHGFRRPGKCAGRADSGVRRPDRTGDFAAAAAPPRHSASRLRCCRNESTL